MVSYHVHVYITVDGVWVDWSSWDTCNVTCGGGIHWRYRFCDGPYYGGSNCTGPDQESKVCSDNPCPSMYLLFVNTNIHNGIS